jgi:DNA-binding NarL/FixJ family response regulator
VILDYQMAEMNAGLVLAAMRGTKPRVPILILSGWMSPPESALDLVDEFVGKGEPVEFLLLAIHQLLSRHKKPKPVRAITQPRVASFDSGARSFDRKLSLLRSG